MSLTSQPVPWGMSVTEYWVDFVVAGCVEVTVSVIVTKNMTDVDGTVTIERIELIVPLPVEACLAAVRCCVRPGALLPSSSVVIS